MPEIGLEDGGREVAVPRGQTLVLRLPENAATGYRWQGETPDALTLVRDDYDAVGAAPGAAAWRVLEYRADRPGRCALALTRRQAWEPSAPGDEAFDITVVVE